MKTYSLILFLLLNYQLSAQITFERIYKTNNFSELGDGYCIATDGNYMVAGRQINYFGTATLMKLNQTGDVIWRKSYPGLDGFTSIINTLDGGFAISGYSDTLISGDLSMLILKTDSAGSVQWCKFYDVGISNDAGLSIMQNQDGSYILTGRGYNSISNTGYAFILKIDPNGTLLWDKMLLGSQAFMYANHASATIDGGVIVIGTYWVINSGFKMLLTKIDSAGQTLWIKSYGENGYNYSGKITHQTTDNGFINLVDMGSATLLLKTDSVGLIQWCKTYSAASYPSDLLINSDGDFLFAAAYQSPIDSASIFLIKTNPQGDSIWTRLYQVNDLTGYIRGEGPRKILQTPDGGYLVGAQVDSFQNDLSVLFILKMDADGNAGCNFIPFGTAVSSVNPTIDTNITFFSGIMTNSILISEINSPIQDSILCIDTQINEGENFIAGNVYPNPTEGNLTINIPDISEMLTIEINDMMGRQILQEKITSGVNNTFDVSTFSKGIYIIRIIGKNETGVRYFCKQ